MSALLGSDAAVTSGVRTEAAEEQYEATCPRGYWCAAGLETPCGEGTYSGELNQHSRAACTRCPADALSAEASVSIEARARKPGQGQGWD